MKPAEVFHPSEYVRDEMHQRGWTRQELANRSGFNVRVVDELLDRERPVNRLVAVGLGAAFGTSPELWTNLQAIFDSEGGTGDRRMKAMKDEIWAIVNEVAVSFEQGQGRVGEIDAATEEIMALIQDRFTTTDPDTSLSEVPLFTQD